MFRSRTIWSSPVGGPYLSTFYSLETVTPQALVDAIGAFWGVIDGVIDSSVSWAVEASVDTILPTTGSLTASTGVTPPSGFGALPGDMGPAAAQGLVRWTTDAVVNGRRVRGRTFVPGISDGVPTEGRLPSATIATWLAAANTLRADADLVVWHRPGPLGVPPGSAHEVTGAGVWNEFAVLTSRRD